MAPPDTLAHKVAALRRHYALNPRPQSVRDPAFAGANPAVLVDAVMSSSSSGVCRAVAVARPLREPPDALSARLSVGTPAT